RLRTAVAPDNVDEPGAWKQPIEHSVATSVATGVFGEHRDVHVLDLHTIHTVAAGAMMACCSEVLTERRVRAQAPAFEPGPPEVGREHLGGAPSDAGRVETLAQQVAA